MEAELRRIADHLERIADAMGAEPLPERESAYANHDPIFISGNE